MINWVIIIPPREREVREEGRKLRGNEKSHPRRRERREGDDQGDD